MASSSSSQHVMNIETVRHQLYRCTVTSEWESLGSLLDNHPDAIRTRVTHNSGTMLHLAIATNQHISFLENLSARMSDPYHDVLTMSTVPEEDTALHYAASFGNLEAAKLLVANNSELPNILNHNDLLPLHEAAKSAHREVFTYLLGLTKDNVNPSPFEGDHGAMLVQNLVTHGFCDLVLELVNLHTDLATKSLKSIACCPSNFASSKDYNLPEILALQGLSTYSRLAGWRFGTNAYTIPLIFAAMGSILFPALLSIISNRPGFVVFVMERVKADKKLHDDSIKLVKFICQILQEINPDEAKVTFQKAAKAAARNGIHEIIEEIIITCPNALFLKNDDRDIGIFHMAVKYRQHKVFNLIFQMSSQRDALLAQKDKHGNTILHIAAKLPSSDRLNLAHGASLQMQRELLWYKAVEKFLPAWVRDAPNNHGIKPRTKFTEQHKSLVKEGEKWMRGTANSGTIVTVLISTITFAAAITVPGGNNSNNGFPIFSKQSAFTVFAISNAISLFSSLTSLLTFLSLLTERYAEQDFLTFLPTNLILALVTLIISIVALMVTCGATIYLVSQKRFWVLLLLIHIAYLTVLVFLAHQLSLFIGMFTIIHGNRIVLKHRDTVTKISNTVALTKVPILHGNRIVLRQGDTVTKISNTAALTKVPILLQFYHTCMDSMGIFHKQGNRLLL